MSGHSPVTALRVANEAFLVASTIERCPKTMMLRELVMNALESAARAPEDARFVRLHVKTVDGAPKLAILNSGPGMSAGELHSICDLASSLRKETGLDRNFGMGAKVASLPSNKHGLRYRSCRDGVVSEVTLGQRDGVYGRLRYNPSASGIEAEVADRTEACRQEGGYDLSSEWTEVVLLGNRPEQNTVLDPYDGDPAVDPRWVSLILSRRFFRLPSGVTLTLPTVRDDQPQRPFRAIMDRIGRFDRWESVPSLGGITIHYGYAANAPEGVNQTAADGLPEFTGLAGLVHRDEVYAVRSGQEWLLDAPNYGFPFGARYCSVFVELPENFHARPEVYRQFLRFTNGDQRQIFLQDFADLVRTSIPGWLRRIIASYGPPDADYIGEITSELRELLAELGVVAEARRAVIPQNAGAKPSGQPRMPAEPRAPVFEKPPEIIALRDQAQIDERDLQRRAGRYYPSSHQLFINLTYSAVTRLQAQLERDFDTAPDTQRRAEVAQELAEWVIIRQLGRAIAFSLAKKTAGWMREEVVRAHSPETLSIVADDYLAMLAPARRRMAEMLGVRLPEGLDGMSISGQTSWTLRLANQLADAEQAARRVLAIPGGNPAPILRRVSAIEMQRGNMEAALDWARQAIEAEPGDALSHSHLSGLLQQRGALEEAEQAILKAIDLSPEDASRYLSQHSTVVAQRGDLPAALEIGRRAIEADPTSMGAYQQLSVLFAQAGALDEAKEVAERGMELGSGNPSRLLRQLSAIEAQRRDLPAAVDWARQSVEADPSDAWSFNHLAGLLLEQGKLDEAKEAVQAGLDLSPANPSRFLRSLSQIEAHRQNLPAALDWAEQAAEASPNDAFMQLHLAGLLTQSGYLDEAEAATRRGLDLNPLNPSRFYRQFSLIEAQRQNLPAAVDWAEQAVAASPEDPWLSNHLAGLLLQAGRLDEAEAVTRRGMELMPGNPSRFYRNLSNIEAQRRNMAAAVDWAEQAVAADPGDAWLHHHLASMLLQAGQLDEAEASIRNGLELTPANPSRFYRHLSVIETRRRNMAAAVELARQSVETDPEDVWGYQHLSGLLLQMGRLDEAEEAAREALRISGDNSAPFRKRLYDIQAQRGPEFVAD